MLRKSHIASILCGLALMAPATAVSQSAPAPTPVALVDAALAGEQEALAAIRRFLGGDGQPENVTSRAEALIAALSGRGQGTEAPAILGLIDRIATEAIGLVAGSQIVRLGVEPDFVPRNAIVAMDFGPPDGEIARGFENVQPGDPRIGGADLAALRRPADSSLLNDGIKGVERVELDVPEGSYRIVLMTQNVGDPELMTVPFGREVVVNGTRFPIARPTPDEWLEDALLTNRGAQTVSNQVTPGDTPADQARRGFIAGDFKSEVSIYRAQQGGAVIVEAPSRDGKLIIEFRGFQATRSYLTGLMVEPVARISDLVLSRAAFQSLAPPDLRLALEERILTSAAAILAQLETAAGPDELVDLPNPILDPEVLASTSG